MVSIFTGLFKSFSSLHIPAMDSSSDVMLQVSFKKHKGLHDNDSRFVEEVIKVVSSLDGSSSMKLKLFTKFPSRFTIILCDPPRMTLNDMNQIFMMNEKIIQIKTDLQAGELRIESFKHNEETKRKRKRLDGYDEMDVPAEYDFSMVDAKDRKHIEGILSSMIGITTIEFSSEIKSAASYYDMEIRDIEDLNVENITEIVQKYRAFITDTIFDYPAKQLQFKIRRNDTPITTIMNTQARKRLKISR